LTTLVQRALDESAVPDTVDIVVRVDGTTPLIWADPDQLIRVFGNLIANAFQAMPDGGILTIAFGHLDHRVVVSITDTGVGIPSESLSKIFEPLYTTKARGIGLGLALAKTLISEHGGEITVESKPGQGTTFYVELPTGRAQHD
jgi:signal transduction histidine kinase